MALENDFDIRQFIPYLLNQAAEESSLAFQNIYKDRYGMLRGEWRVLFHLGIYDRMTAKDITDRARIHKTKVSRAVHKMQAKGYLRRVKDQNDRRKEWLQLTTLGRTVYEDLRRAAKDYDTVLSDSFSDGDIAGLKRLLVQLGHPY
tara:strand:+ start:206 stop:643 length:438 start_codon:yes stop_codon:yes gene_type:complete